MNAPRQNEAAPPGSGRAYRRRQAGATDRFPGFDIMSQARHWDRVTAELVTSRLAAPPPLAFFHPAEQDCAGALLNLLAGQEDEPGIPVLEMVDARLAAGETDGWRYADMPEDGQAWPDTLAHLDDDAKQRPAYPRGYKNAGVGKREPFETLDARPARDPVREGA